ncbi:MAG: hypothetical protein ACN2B6_12470 [Rickettsiales bacterium]
MNFDQQFNNVFKGEDLSPRNIGKHLCKMGVPHSDKWNEETTAGYAEQYASEQEEAARSEQ